MYILTIVESMGGELLFVDACDTEEVAMALLHRFVLDTWNDYDDDTPIPEDMNEAIDVAYERAMGSGRGFEWAISNIEGTVSAHFLGEAIKENTEIRDRINAGIAAEEDVDE